MKEERGFDPQFKYQVAARPGGEGLMACFSCGVCTAGCPVSEVEIGFNPRRIIHQILVGDRETLLPSQAIWMCIGCYTCTAHCPQDVEFTNLLKVLRDIAIEEGYVKPYWKKMVEEVDRRTQKLRRDLIAHLWDTDQVQSWESFIDF
ncbi:MAG: 4Fe-4S dicluster domain-containing protein, partial [Candidatus Atribacteria bacterium]|nr:4Fe-4S dicluster domain-containing protein [Candidatus Atribacteria bacterium]